MIFAYTFRNGVKSVVMTDCIQTACLIIVTVILLVEAFSAVNGDFIDVFNYVSSEGLSKTFDFESVSYKTHFIKQFISGAFIVVVMTGLDQDVMQKNLTCRNLKEAQKNMVMTGFLFKVLLCLKKPMKSSLYSVISLAMLLFAALHLVW